VTNEEIAAVRLLEEYTTLKTSLHQLEVEHEGLFMQRNELESAAFTKLAEFKEAVKQEKITYLANSMFEVTAEQTYRKVDLNAKILVERHPGLVKTGIITEDHITVYAIDKKRLKGAVDAGLVTQADLDAATPERTPYAYPVTIKPKGG
jgi:tRNA A37 methylthiotransferase MiaB